MNIIYTPSPLLKEVKFRNDNLPVIIRVNKFDESSAKDFSTQMMKAQNTGQPVVPVIIDSYGGPLLEKEIESINLIIKNRKKPVTCIIGGSKISTKINIIKNLIPKFENIIIVGAMANNLIKYKGFEIGKSKKEDNCNQIINKIFLLVYKIKYE